MAVENKWVTSEMQDGKLPTAANVKPSQILACEVTFEVAADDDNGSIYKLFSVGSNMIPLMIWINNDAITAGTDYDLGLYEEDGVTEADKDCFADGADLSSAHASGSELSGLTAMNIANIGSKKMYEIAGDTIDTKQQSYTVALTANTVGSAAGTITVRALFLQG